MTRFASLLAATIFGAAFTAKPVLAQTAKVSKTEEVVIAAYLKILRASFLPDGAINMTERGPAPTSPVWIAPYFADHVALAILAANDFKKNASDVALVGKWIDWRVARQEKGGYWHDFTGTNAAYKSNGKVDAHDSSAAMFLLVLERYQRAGGKISDKMRDAAKASLKCIVTVTDRDGLTWAKPTYLVKYLMDNIEVHAGLKASEAFFTKTKDAAEAKDCGVRAGAIGKLLPKYFEAKDKGLFAWALHPSGAYDGGFDKLYPHGLAQLFAVAFVQPEAGAFESVVKTFPPETGATATGTERYLIAAARIGRKAEATWRLNVIQDPSLMKKETYNYRPALAILGLLEGANWMSKP
jgi:hypothetical protein